MLKIILSKILIILVVVIAGCANPVHELDKLFALKATNWVFVNVNVVDIEQGEIQKSRDVFVKDGVIKEIVKHGLQEFSEFQAIPGENLFLSPGLIDSHVHIYSKKDLILYVVNGVTGVQNMWGFESAITLLGMPHSLELKNHIKEGGFGPWLWTSGPILEGENKTHPLMSSYVDKVSAEQEVARQQKLGYDFIKTYDWLSPEVFSAIVSKASELKIPVKGHVPYAVTVEDAIKKGLAEIEHLTGWIDIDSSTINVSDKKLDETAKLAHDKNVSVCPSLLVFRRVMPQEKAKIDLYNHPYRKYLSSFNKWLENQGASSMRDNVKVSLENYPKSIKQVQERVLINLIKNNVNVVACTDAGNPYIYPGISLHEEMSLLQAVGISSDKVLQMATVNAAKALGEQDKRGTIQQGFIADLVLLEKNPLKDIHNLKLINGVMLRGKWIQSSEFNHYMEILQ